jgi:hypothetical protein
MRGAGMIHAATIVVVAAVGVATLVICVGIRAYANGFSAGVNHCVREMAEQAKQGAMRERA